MILPESRTETYRHALISKHGEYEGFRLGLRCHLLPISFPACRCRVGFREGFSRMQNADKPSGKDGRRRAVTQPHARRGDRHGIDSRPLRRNPDEAIGYADFRVPGSSVTISAAAVA